MSSVQTIDVKGLEHQEREEKIFPGVDKLDKGDSLRIITEFNPLPLVYLLEARNEFGLSFEKEGPEEWILRVTRIREEERAKDNLRELMVELKEGQVSEETKERARGFFRSVDARTIGELEQDLIREGVSHEEVRKSLCDIHLEVMKDSLVEKRIEVSPPHPIHTLMEEHRIIQDTLKRLKSLVDRMNTSDSLESSRDDLEDLKDVAHHLVEAENHHQREEEALFPALEKHGVEEPPRIMKMDHVEFRKRKKELYQLAHNPEAHPFERFRGRVVELGNYLAKELDSHIFKEDNILYQIALQVLSQEDWDEVKKECDKVGYCCFTPQDVERSEYITVLDLRPMPPFERHSKIFEIWEGLASGAAMRIINDHDPKPLHYQFEAEEKGKYVWNYEQEGPRDWIVKIQRT